MKIGNVKQIIKIVFILVLFLTSCSNDSEMLATATLPEEAFSPTDTISPTNTSFPTDTPTPQKMILYAPDTVPAEQVNAMETLLSRLAGQSAFVFEVKRQLGEDDLDESPAFLVLLSENGIDVNSMANQHPETTLIVLREGVEPDFPSNVISLIADPNTLQFAAGFVSILIAPDWRLGALLPWDDEISGAENLEAFNNGSAYHCGRCASTYMPVALFPVTNSLPSASAPESWMEAITILDNQYYLYTVYVSAEAASDQLYQQLVTQNVTVVGAKKPDGIEGLLWAASINQDIAGALETNWDAILNDTLAENEIIVPVVLSEVDEEYLSPGRMRLYDEMMEALTQGWITPLSPEYP